MDAKPMKTQVAASAMVKAHVAHFATSGRLDVIETWLNKNAKSGWVLRTEGVSDDLSVKKYALTFRDRSDYNAFRSRFTAAA